MKTTARQCISDIAEDCIDEASQIQGLLDELSDSEQIHPLKEWDELFSALRATSDALRGIRGVLELEVERASL